MLYICFIWDRTIEEKNLAEAYNKIKKVDYSMFSKECISKYDRILKQNIEKYKLDDISSTGYVVATLEATLWTILTTDSFDSAIIKAINLGNDTDTVGACVGGLVGIYYGLENINKNWIMDLQKYDYIENLCNQFNLILN